jgi:BAI1-associated protein 3
LYQEILYELLHSVGCNENEVQLETIYSYLQDAFKISPEKHDELLSVVGTKDAPDLRLNLEVIEGKDLNSKDPNGLADPFVTLFIASTPERRYNSSVKAATLNPKWEEHFSLPITENPNDESLIVEVWDFDPAETFSEKMKKIPEVKGLKGMSKFMKEIATTVSSGRHENELVGRSNIPLKSIPTSGLTMWYNLEKKNKLKAQGLIKIRMNFSSEKNDQVAIQEHRHLLRLLLLHELETSKVAQYWWSGKFTASGEHVLVQHAAQSGLTDVDEAFAQWSIFTEIHPQYPLAFSLFDGILDKLIRPVQTKSVYHEDELNIFWEATKRLLPSCFSKIRKIRKDIAGEKNVLKTLTEVLNIISKVAMLEPPEGTNLFPEQYYG